MEIVRVNRIKPAAQAAAPKAKPAEKPKAPPAAAAETVKAEAEEPQPKAKAKTKRKKDRRLKNGRWPHVTPLPEEERTDEQRALIRAVAKLQHLAFRAAWQSRAAIDLPQLQLFCATMTKQLETISQAVAGTELRKMDEHPQGVDPYHWTERQRRVVEAGDAAHRAAYRANKIARRAFDETAAKQAAQDAIVAMAGVLGAFDSVD